MLVSHSHKFIFIRTRKVGGTSLMRILNNFFDKNIDIKSNNSPYKRLIPHAGWKEAMDIVTADQWKSYFKFTIERNPWDKVVSQYCWKLNKHNRDNLGFFKNPHCPVEGFNEWVTSNQQELNNLCEWEKYTENSKLVVDEVIRYEDYFAGVSKVLNDILNLNVSLDSITNTRSKSGANHRAYVEYYDRRCRD